MALTTRTSRSWMSRMMWVPLWVRPMPMCLSWPCTRRVTVPDLSTRSCRIGTSGGVEERPTYNRFSTPYSVPLKTLSIQLQYVDTDTGLQTGYAFIDLATDGTATITDRVDIGVP